MENATQSAAPPLSPTPAQQAWMDLEFGLFLHYGVNTYHDCEWSDGTLDAGKVNPTHLNTNDWCRVARDAGMRYVVPVTKHHDGFCNWNTRHTDYRITKTPYGRDLLEELAASADRFGLKLGLYYSLWDCRHPAHDTDEAAYVDYMSAQLTELLTGYGEIVELWFDGFWKKQQTGWQTTEAIDGELNKQSASLQRDQAFIDAWRKEGAQRWQMDRIYSLIKSLQPDCMVLNNATTAYPGVPLHPVDVRSGEKATDDRVDNTVWPVDGEEKFFPLQIETTLSVKGDTRFPSGNWFWHDWDHSVASAEQITAWRKSAKALNANLLLNAGPTSEGTLRTEDVEVLARV